MNLSQINQEKKKKIFGFFVFAVYLLFLGFLVYKNFFAGPPVIVLEIKNGQIVNQDSRIEIKKGSKVSFKITADTSEDFHIEGYHLFGNLDPNKTLWLTLKAESAGNFPILLNRSGTLVGHLVVSE
jgi:hypothetical protein